MLLGKVSPWEVTWKGVCLPGLKSSTELACSQAHDVESSAAFPGEKRREENETWLTPLSSFHWLKHRLD